MIGYKGIVIKNGILRSKYGDIFEINVPRELCVVDDGIAFSENGYSFCGTIEDVVEYESYISSAKGRIYHEARLFEIETINGNVIGSPSHYKTSEIKLTREITQKEILEYLSDNKLAREKVIAEVGEDLLKTFSKDKIEPYKFIKNEDEINDIYVRSCARLGQKGLCFQNTKGFLRPENCNGCAGIAWNFGLLTYEKDYLYLIARKKLLQGQELEKIMEYKILEDKKCKYECQSLKRYLNFIKK